MQTPINQQQFQIAVVMTARMMFPKSETLVEALDELYLYYKIKPKGSEENERDINLIMATILQTRRELILSSVELERQFTGNNIPSLQLNEYQRN